MRILHVAPNGVPVGFRFGGAVQRRVLRLSEAQRNQGHEVVTLCPGPLDEKVDQVDATIYKDLRLHRPWSDWEYAVRAGEAATALRPDVVHVHNHHYSGYMLPRSIPRVLSFDFFTYRGYRNPLVKRVHIEALRRFSVLCPVSVYCASAFQDVWGQVRPLRCLPNGVGRSEAVASANDSPTFGYLGRVCEQKGSLVLAEAFRLLRCQMPDARLLVAGPPDRFGSSGSNASTRRLEFAGAEILGAIAEEEISDFFQRLTAFVMPTIELEMFGMSALEAQSHGVPVIASRHGGLPEVLDELASVLVPPGEPVLLAGAMLNVARDPELNLRLRVEGPLNAARFEWDRIAERSIEIYTEVLG